MDRLDVTPDPDAWPECPTCGAAYVLRRNMIMNGGPGGNFRSWVWQRDCKHRGVDPKVAERRQWSPTPRGEVVQNR
jgi:hypothetical protein